MDVNVRTGCGAFDGEPSKRHHFVDDACRVCFSLRGGRRFDVVSPGPYGVVPCAHMVLCSTDYRRDILLSSTSTYRDVLWARAKEHRTIACRVIAFATTGASDSWWGRGEGGHIERHSTPYNSTRKLSRRSSHNSGITQHELLVGMSS